MTVDYGTAILSAQKIRRMQKGNVVMLISLAVLVLNAVLALVLAAKNPITFYVTGGMETLFVLTIISGIAALVGSIMYLVGLYGLREVQPEYRTAFTCEIGLIVLGVVTNFIGKENFLGQFLEAVRTIGSVAVLWLVVQGTRRLLEGQNQERLLRQGELVWKLNLAAIVLTILWQLLPISGELNSRVIAILAVGIVLSLLSFLVLIYYVSYLGRAAKALEDMALGLKTEAEGL